MPDMDAETCKQLLLQFQTGLPSAVTTQLRATSESYDLEKALERAKLLMTIKDEEQTAAVKQKDRLLELDELNIHQLAEIAAPLHHLMQKNVPFAWNNYCQKAFDSLKERLSQVPILSYPQFGPSGAPFCLHTDASATGIGAVLEHNRHVIAYAIAVMPLAQLLIRSLFRSFHLPSTISLMSAS